MTMGEYSFAQRAEAFRWKNIPPLLRTKSRRVFFERLHDPAQSGNPRSVVIANIPDQAEGAAGPQHAVNLSHRLCGRKPVKRLRANHRIDRCILERDLLRRTAARIDFWIALLKLV